MYFAVVDREIRATSDGNARSTICCSPCWNAGARNQPLDEVAWISLVTKELGEKGKSEFEEMLSGATMLPQLTHLGHALPAPPGCCDAINSVSNRKY